MLAKTTQQSTFSKMVPIFVALVASSFYFYEYLIRVMPSAITHSLMLSFNIQAAGLGLLASLYFYGYAPMQIPSGILYDRFGPRVLLSISILLCAIATFVFGATENYYVALIARFVTGATASFAFVGALIIGANWFPARHFAFYAGAVQFLGCIGAILGQGPIAYINSALGWHKTAMAIAFLGILLAALNWLVIRDYPPHVAKQRKIKAYQPIAFKTIFSNAQNWWIGFYAFFIWAPIVSFAVLWGVPYLHDTYHFSKIHSASITSIAWIGIAIGGPVSGWLSDHISRRKLPLIVAASVGLTASLFLLYLNHLPTTVIAILLFLIGFSSSSQSVLFGMVNDINPKRTLGTVIGFTNMMVIGGGVVIQPLIGVILQYLWQGQTMNAVPIYSAHSFQIALSLIPISFFIALTIALIFIRETFCKHQYE